MQPLVARMSLKWIVAVVVLVPPCVGVMHLIAPLGRSSLGAGMDRMVAVADVFGAIVFLAGTAGIALGVAWHLLPLFVIDETGLFARGLGLPVIPWSEIDDVLLVSTMGRTDTGDMICVRLKEPGPYIERLTGLRRAAQAANRRKGLEHLSVPVMFLDVPPARLLATAKAFLDAASTAARQV